jgi:hypothetical protein
VFAPGKQIEAPTGWNREDDVCLACAKEDETPGDRARRMLLDGTPLNKTARSCAGVTHAAARAIRAELVEEGELPPDSAKPTPKPKPKSKAKPKGTDRRTARARERTERIEAELRADPSRPNSEIAQALQVPASRVRAVRREMGIPKPTKHKKRAPRAESKTARAKEALTANPSRTNADVADEVGASISVVRVARRSLGLSPSQVVA